MVKEKDQTTAKWFRVTNTLRPLFRFTHAYLIQGSSPSQATKAWPIVRHKRDADVAEKINEALPMSIDRG